jgi:tetratricopeptide (TPR) repeat protein
LDQLTVSLADRYRIERELGRGGMATVYLAQDLKHDRPVALKVLHPEIAATLGPERFLREIRLTARLQHPHILPVFDSGAVEGRPWYSMPYVRGESLRERLRREIQLPLDTALDITRQVAHALAYAHREGAVHRDIKPENILLSEGQALVADFGVARAIGSAEEHLTGSGMAIGTPAYMSPEQASGSPVDQRADVYALGCVLYEMLAGEAPFTGPTPQAIVAKRFAHPPPAIRVLRPAVPEELEAAIRRALAPIPADRFAGAEQFAHALTLKQSSTEVATAAVPARPRRFRRPHGAARWGLLLAAGLGVTAAGYLLSGSLRPRPPTLFSTGVLRERERILVADFESRGQDSLIGPAVTEAFRIDFAGSPVLTVMPAAKVREALERMRLPANSPLMAALAREVAVREGVKALVIGQVARIGGGFLLSAQLVSTATGEVLAAHRETAPDSGQVIAAIDRLSGRLRESIGEPLRSLRSEPPLTKLTTGSLEALRKYIEGQVAGDVEVDYVRAVSLLEEAVALDSGFATAYRTLGAFHGRLGNREREVVALTKAFQHSDRLTEQEREHTRAIYYTAITGEVDEAVTTYRALLRRDPRDSLARNNLAVLYYVMHQHARAESLFRTGLDTVSPWTPGILLNLAMAVAALGKRSQAERLVEQSARLFPDAAGVDWYRIRVAASADDYAAAHAIALASRDKYADTPFERAFDSRELAAIALVRGRLAEAEQYTRQAMTESVEAGHPADHLKDAAALGFIDTWFRRRPDRGLRTLEEALGRYPLDSIRPLERPYLTLAIAYASGGRAERARALLGEYEREIEPRLRRIEEPMRRWAWGQVAMAEGRFVEAIAQFQAYVPTPRSCLPCGQSALAQAYDRQGNVDSAIAVYERYLSTPSFYRLNEQGIFATDATQLAPACKRLGELYEQRGDRAKARHYYARFVRLWAASDPELGPAVQEVKSRLGRLGPDAADPP